MAKLPAIQFYPADWRKDIAVQSLSFQDRGIWFELLCVMHESEERGKLIQKGKPMNEVQIARLIGCEIKVFRKFLENVLELGVAYKDENGCIYNKRMVKDDELISKRRAAGKMGGNPVLLNQTVNHKDNHTTNHHPKQKTTPSSSSSFSSSKEREETPTENFSNEGTYTHDSVVKATLEDEKFIEECCIQLSCTKDSFTRFVKKKLGNWKISGRSTQYSLGSLKGFLLTDYPKENVASEQKKKYNKL